MPMPTQQDFDRNTAMAGRARLSAIGYAKAFAKRLPSTKSAGRTKAGWLPIAVIALTLHNHSVFAAAACASKASEDTTIVVDVGHVSKQPGMRCELNSPVPCPWGETSARGLPEYDFNLALAQQIKDGLVASGFRSTYLMITHMDREQWLAASPEQQKELLQQKNLERANRANNMNADLFLSIHHDGVRDQYLKPWVYQGQRHFYFDDSKGFSLHIPHLPQGSARYRDSLGLAQVLADQLIKSGLGFTSVHQAGNPVGAGVPFADPARGIYERVDHLIVLSYTKMPALLLEAGVIVNRDEESTVSTPEYRTTIATAVTEAVGKFCNAGENAPTYGVVNVRSDG